MEANAPVYPRVEVRKVSQIAPKGVADLLLEGRGHRKRRNPRKA
jgi:hypothetical protein